MAALTQIFHLLRNGYMAQDILKAVTKTKPEIATSINKLLDYGYEADALLKAMTDKKDKTTPSMFRSEFGDYLRRINDQSQKDYNKLIKGIVMAGATAKEAQSIFKKYGKPPIEVLPPEAPKKEMPSVAKQPTLIAPIPTMERPVETQVQAQPQVVPKRRQIATAPEMPQEPIALAPPGGLTPKQQTIAMKEASLAKERQQPAQPSAPIILEQQIPVMKAQPQVAPQPMMPVVQPIAMQPSTLFSTQQYAKNPTFGNALDKVIKQGLSKKQIMELIKKAFSKQAREFEQETGRSIEEEVDAMMGERKEKRKPKLPQSKEEKLLENAGLKPKVKQLRTKGQSMLEQLVEPPMQKKTTENVDKQAFLMEMQKLKDILGR